jgi:hypothetical protein
MLCSKSDKELREQLFEATAKDGLLGPKLSAAQAAAGWVQLWLASSEVERETLLMLLTARTRLQVRRLPDVVGGASFWDGKAEHCWCAPARAMCPVYRQLLLVCFAHAAVAVCPFVTSTHSKSTPCHASACGTLLP